MKLRTKLFTVLTSLTLALSILTPSISALTHTVAKGDSMWKIASKYEVGLDELRRANPEIKNAALIYPGQKINVPQIDSGVLEFEAEVVRLVNTERTKRGLSPLSADWQLSRTARFKSEDMSENSYFSHTSATYGTPFEMIKNFGISYKSAGENIARGYRSPAAVVEGWMNSSGHRANILNASFTHIGVGYAADGHYWTQMFIRK